jgi:hypothetical protein
MEDMTQRNDETSDPARPTGLRLCKACNREFEYDEYLDHVYENMDCYRAYLASEKKEMSKQ